MQEQHVQDIATLAQSALLSRLPPGEIGLLLNELTPLALNKDAALAPTTGAEPALHFVLEGRLELEDARGARARLAPGDVFGVSALVGRPETERVVASSDVRLARLSAASFAKLAYVQPQFALHMAQAALIILLEKLERAPAPGANLLASLKTVTAPVEPRGPNGCLGDGLPREVEGALVVAGRVGERLLSLRARVSGSTLVAPVTTRDWEGRDVYRRSVGLVLLEAARQLAIPLQLGPSITSGRLVLLATDGDHGELARLLEVRVTEMIRASVAVEEELWQVEDAIELFRAQHDANACLLLEDSLEPVVTLLRCGETRVAVPRPLLPHAGLLRDVHLVAHPLGLLLDFGSPIREALPRRAASTIAMELAAPRYGAPMTRRELEWLKFLGIESVGTFNRACVAGRVQELIRVSEGFHEKRIAEIADQVQQRGGVRIVAVAGPSSSGKTTFIKRLLVQLRVNGIEPLELSLDDYYLDRARQPRDAHGEFDFEALDALDLKLFRADIGALLAGSAVRPPRYDFQQGLSRPGAGAELRVGARNVLLVEGIHALNPELYGSAERRAAFNVFIHPATSLPFDRLSSLEPADVRLLRRIVRDRHQRGFAAVETLARWPSVRRGERLHIFSSQGEADAVFDSSLVYEVSVLRGYAERYLLEVPRSSPEAASARRLRELLQLFVPIHPDHVPPTSLLREFIGGSGFTY